eukprot:SM000061S19281  [mRNA]  locus=s61:551761:555792:+ [translate_table: standard]
MAGFLKAAAARARGAAEFARDAAFELNVVLGFAIQATEAQEALRTGLGIPRAVSNIAGLSVAAVAAAGTAAVTFDLVSKFYGPKECQRCSGWEGLCCSTCGGSGEQLIAIRSPNLKRGESVTVAAMAAAFAGGRVGIIQLPGSLDAGLPLPRRTCTACDGTGVMKCPECHGQAFKNKISFDRIFDAPLFGWDAQLRTKPTNTNKAAVLTDPGNARFLLFERPELEGGFTMPEDVKHALWWQYENAAMYDMAREKVVRKEAGWEAAQQMMAELDPDRALQDPAIVQSFPEHRVQRELLDRAAALPPPPRPEEWVKLPPSVEAPDWRKLQSPEERREWEAILAREPAAQEALLDHAWRREWHEAQTAAAVQEALLDVAGGVRRPAAPPLPQPRAAEGGGGAPAAARQEEPPPGGGKGKAEEEPLPGGKDKAAAKKGKAPAPKKPSAEELRRREKEEKVAKMAQHAAEREAALARAKEAKGRRS